MTYKNFLFAISVFLLGIHTYVFPQQKIKPPEMPVEVIKYPHDERIVQSFETKTQEKISKYGELMLDAKKRGDVGGVEKISKELDFLTGNVSGKGEKFEQTLLKTSGSAEHDNINAGLVDGVTGVKGIATVTEQLGSTATRIWTAFGYGPDSGPTADALRICFSDDGGRTWTQKVTLGFSSGNRMWRDEIDMEILEPSSGDKYLWIVFGYATNNYSGVYRIGVDVIKITGTLNYAGYTLNWPGTVNSNFYYRPRIVSDNEYYRSNPWIYITCTFDSAVAGGYRSGEKVAMVYGPYTVSPTFSYKSTSFMGLAFVYPSDFHSDIAYFRNGGSDSIFMVESTLGDSGKIAIAKTSISNFIINSTYLGAFNVTPARRYEAYVATGGGYDDIMIVNMRKYSETDWDIEYFQSTTGSLGSWSTGYVDYTGTNSTRADIVGFRSAPGFYASAYSSTDFGNPVTYAGCTNNVWDTYSYQMNHSASNPYHAKPRPGIRYGPQGESCLALWTEYSGGTNVWASVGCSGPIGIWRNVFFRGVMQGFWDEPADTLRNDTVTLQIRNDFPPYSVVEQSNAYLDNDGYANFWFMTLQNFTNYYIAAKHRNTIETWSAATFQYGSGSTSYSYDFTTSPLQSYGVNETLVDTSPDLYAFYSGDVNQDETIDLTDIVLVFNDGNSFLTGYVNTDTNGDQFVDLTDLVITFNNSNNFISVIKP